LRKKRFARGERIYSVPRQTQSTFQRGNDDDTPLQNVANLRTPYPFGNWIYRCVRSRDCVVHERRRTFLQQSVFQGTTCLNAVFPNYIPPAITINNHPLRGLINHTTKKQI